eukprot:GGOE01013724.1.p1 GENE.GGOE01013724.1~~GGOE01013724.1.p1  ORF type:complete len:393 (-),score=85.52 GGOE01013724.1:245-1372(-)
MWPAVVSLLAWVALERAGRATQVEYHDVPDIPKWSPMDGPYTVNTRLRDGIREIAKGLFDTSESVAVDAEGNVFVTNRRGDIFRLVNAGTDAEEAEVWARTGGALLGLEVDRAGRLWIADGARGLLAVDPTTRLATMHATHATSKNGSITPILFADDLVIASDQKIYFTDACNIPPTQTVTGAWNTLEPAVLDFMTGNPTGRLLRYDPATHTTSVLLEDIWFANGVALSADESFLAVAETYRFRILRYWLKGPKAGTSDVLIDELPGCPDGVDAAIGGGFWVSIPTPAPARAEFLARHRPLRAFVARLGKAVQPRLVPWATIVKVSEAGEVVDCIHDPDGQRVKAPSAAKEYNGKLYIGSLRSNFIPVFNLGQSA